uniref:Uncharacterized protein n=1 Tax=Haemonchus contortus TaxID=6289 RepID=A0A7I4Y4V2_HAECO
MQCLLLALLFLLPSVVVSGVDSNGDAKDNHPKDNSLENEDTKNEPIPDIHGLSREMFGQELEKLDPDVVKPETPEAQRILAQDDADLELFVVLVYDALKRVNNGHFTKKRAALEIQQFLLAMPDEKRNMMETRYPSLKPKRSPVGKKDSSHEIGDDARKKLLDRLSEEMFGEKVKDVTIGILDDESNPVVARTLEAVRDDKGALSFVHGTITMINIFNKRRHSADHLVEGIEMVLGHSGSEELLLKTFPTLKEIIDHTSKPKIKETKPADATQEQEQKIKTTQPSDDQKRKDDKSEEVQGLGMFPASRKDPFGGGESEEAEPEDANQGQGQKIRTTQPNNDQKTVEPKGTENSFERNLLNLLSEEIFGEKRKTSMTRRWPMQLLRSRVLVFTLDFF